MRCRSRPIVTVVALKPWSPSTNGGLKVKENLMVSERLSETSNTDADTTKTPRHPLVAPLLCVMMLNVPDALMTIGSGDDICSFILTNLIRFLT